MSYRDELDANEFTRLNTRIAELEEENQRLKEQIKFMRGVIGALR